MSNTYLYAIFLFFLIILQYNSASAAASVPAIFIFGDSTVDAGNNNHLLTLVKANFKPYGKDFPNKSPTGRFTNGKLATDFFSELLGLPDIVPAYLDPQFRGVNILHGSSFASAASGLSDVTAKLSNVLTMEEQLKLFRQYKFEISTAAGIQNTTQINEMISEGLFLMSAGTVDFTNMYLLEPGYLKNPAKTSEFQDIIMSSLATFTEAIYAEGARRFVVLSIPPFGCLPSQITLHNLIGNTCVEEMNMVAQSTNIKLQNLIKMMNNKFQGLNMMYVDIYDLLLEMSKDPQKFGFLEARKGCCGTGLLEASLLCNPSTPTCRNASEYVYWDSFHPTSTACSMLAKHAFEQLSL